MIELLGQETTILILAVNGLIGSGITAIAIYSHSVDKNLTAAAIDLCCPTFPSKLIDTQTIVPLSLPCCWSFDPVTEYIWTQLRETALSDEVISEEERQITDKILLDVRSFGEVLERTLKDGLIDEKEQASLIQDRNRIWIEANNAAVQPGEVSDDVKQILSRLSELLEYIDAKNMFEIIDEETG
jgi:hypothetical protein